MQLTDFQVIVGPEPRTFRGDAHLVANGAEVTLCSMSTTGFEPQVGTSAEELDSSLCWLCELTATR